MGDEYQRLTQRFTTGQPPDRLRLMRSPLTCKHESVDEVLYKGPSTMWRWKVIRERCWDCQSVRERRRLLRLWLWRCSWRFE